MFTARATHGYLIPETVQELMKINNNVGEGNNYTKDTLYLMQISPNNKEEIRPILVKECKGHESTKQS
jgi:DNA-directed RNA polymerase subunit F